MRVHGVGQAGAGLSDFNGLRVLGLEVLHNIVYFSFGDSVQHELRIGVESEWLIRDAYGTVVRSGQPRPNEAIPEPPLGSTVVAAEARPPRSIVFSLTSGHTIEIVDTSDRYESFSIP